MNYPDLKQAITAEIAKGLSAIEAAYRRQTVVTHWNIGRVLNESLDLSSSNKNAQNARFISRLSRDFKRSKQFFYVTAKFNRLFPAGPKESLTWSHYKILVRFDNDKQRLALEQKALRRNLSAQDLGALIGGFQIESEQKQLLPKLRAKGAGRLPVTRGRLYHYRVYRPVRSAPLPGRVLVDLGFSIERDAALRQDSFTNPGTIMRAIKRGEDYDLRGTYYRPEWLYTYKAAVIKVIDGDTLSARVDAGFRVWVTWAIRLRGINCREITRESGMAARQYVRDRLAKVKFVVIKTYKQEKYGRFLGDVFYKAGETDPEAVAAQGTFLNQELLDAGYATLYSE